MRTNAQAEGHNTFVKSSHQKLLFKSLFSALALQDKAREYRSSGGHLRELKLLVPHHAAVSTEISQFVQLCSHFYFLFSGCSESISDSVFDSLV